MLDVSVIFKKFDSNYVCFLNRNSIVNSLKHTFSPYQTYYAIYGEKNNYLSYDNSLIKRLIVDKD